MSTSTDRKPSFEPMHGSCTCGAVKYTINAPLKGGGFLCHCLDCQRMTGSAYSWNKMIPKEALKVEGPYKLWCKEEDKKDNGEEGGLAFCGECSTHFAAYLDDPPNHVNLRMGTLDKADRDKLGKPSMEMFTCRKPGWVQQIEGAAQFAEMPN